MVDRVLSYFGSPIQILSDRGRNFESRLFNENCVLAIDKRAGRTFPSDSKLRTWESGEQQPA